MWRQGSEGAVRIVKPYFQDDAVTIYHGDCREVFASKVLSKRVDCVVTDPPYGVGFNYGTELDDSAAGYIDRLWPIIRESEGLTLAGGYVVCFQSAKYAREWAKWFPREWRLMALPKRFAQILPVRVQWATDYALFWHPEGQSTYQPDKARDWFISSTVLKGRDPLLAGHPCPRPIDTMRYVVNAFCPDGGTILDPFMGSGTTLRAAKDLGRKAIGIEIDERYCEIAAKRMSQAVLL